jgi:D-inositol-3-phosphate glycosyltransferase
MSYSVLMLSIHTSPLDSPGRTKDAGGMNVYMRQLALELGHRNTTVDIFTRQTNEHTPRIVYLSKNVRVIHIQTGPLAPIHKDDLYQHIPAFTQQIAEFVSAEGLHYDVIHSHYWLAGVAGMQLARRWDIPHVTMFHTLARLKQLANPNEQEPQLRLDTEQRLLQNVDCIIVATADERMQMIRSCGIPPHRITVVPCGVDLTLFTPQNRMEARKQLGLKPHKPVLLFVGRLDPFKGPDLLLRAVAMMEEDAQVVLAGGKLHGDNDLQQLRKLATELGISQRVHFIGARPQQELPTLYSGADVTVVPSYYESFGLVAVESLACGTPVVATRVGGLTTVVKHGKTGYLVPRCPGFFAERLDALLRNTEVWEQMHASTRSSVLQYSWKSIASQVYAVYDNLIEEERFVAAL